MSRGRPRHQASRRRMYSPRQRELRERRLRADGEEQYWLTDTVAAVDAEELTEPEARPTWAARLSGRASAA